MFVGCLKSQQHASVSQGRICSDKFTCCHTEIETADPTFYLTQSQYTDTGLTSPQRLPHNARRLAGSPLECQFLSHRYDSTRKNPGAGGIEPRTFRSRGGRLNHGANEAVLPEFLLSCQLAVGKLSCNWPQICARPHLVNDTKSNNVKSETAS